MDLSPVVPAAKIDLVYVALGQDQAYRIVPAGIHAAATSPQDGGNAPGDDRGLVSWLP
jgi:hypothetical protein